MKRLAILAGLAVALAVPSLASAHHTARGSTKRAILTSLESRGPGGGSIEPGSTRVNDGHNCMTLAVSCWDVTISANSWAGSEDLGPGNDGIGEWHYISHLTHGRWRYVGGWGEGFLFPCGQKHMSRNVARDLKVPCR
jgi:hypothetical protein